jgi:hypothetical protein
MTEKPGPSAEERAAAFEFTWGEGWGAIRKRFAAELTAHAEAAVRDEIQANDATWQNAMEALNETRDKMQKLAVAEAAKAARDRCAELESKEMSVSYPYRSVRDAYLAAWSHYAAAIRALDGEGK